LNGTQLLVYADDVNIPGGNINAVLLEASMEVGLEVNAEKTEDIVVFFTKM
jgi:hypothetical protein